MIDSLTETYKSLPTIYFYCNYGELERQTTRSIIGALLKQLCHQSKKLDQYTESIFDSNSLLNIRTSETAFAATLSQFKRVFVVVDALDECSQEERDTMVSFFTRQVRLAKCQLNIFLTSRPENDLHQLLKNTHTHHIDANDTDKDIRPFVEASLKKLINDKALLGGKVEVELAKELVHKISTQSNGMYVTDHSSPASIISNVISFTVSGFYGRLSSYSSSATRQTKRKSGNNCERCLLG